MRDRPGSSAHAEFRRARRVARRRRVVSSAFVVAAAVLGVSAATGRVSPPILGAPAAGAALLAWGLRPDRDVQRWLRGAAGEESTARVLAGLPRRFVVLHDRRVPGTRANIDHLVIGPTGVWVVDSKAYRAPVRVRRGAVWAGDHRVDTSPAAWEAERVTALLGGPDVGAVVAVHGGGPRRRGKRVGEVRVIPAGRLCRRLRGGRRVLTRSAVAALAADADRLLPPALSRQW